MRVASVIASLVLAEMVVLLPAFAMPGMAADKMPNELMGKWAEATSPEGACEIQITAGGYTGGTEDRYGCTVQSVRKASRPGAYIPSWNIGFICVGEFGKVRSNELMELQAGESPTLKVVILGPKEAFNVVNSRVWTWHKCQK